MALDGRAGNDGDGRRFKIPLMLVGRSIVGAQARVLLCAARRGHALVETNRDPANQEQEGVEGQHGSRPTRVSEPVLVRACRRFA